MWSPRYPRFDGTSTKQSQKKQAFAIASPAFTVCPCKNVQSNRATNTNIASYRNYMCRTTEPCLQFFSLEIHQARYFLRDHRWCLLVVSSFCSSKKIPETCQRCRIIWTCVKMGDAKVAMAYWPQWWIIWDVGANFFQNKAPATTPRTACNERFDYVMFMTDNDMTRWIR